MYEFTEAENRPTYIGLANTIPGVAGALAPLIGGWLAGAVSYPGMFILCGADRGGCLGNAALCGARTPENRSRHFAFRTASRKLNQAAEKVG